MLHQSALLDINFTTSQKDILFRLDRLNSCTIIETASRIHGSAGPSALDAAAWYNMLQKHEEQSTRLANALAKTAIPIGPGYGFFQNAPKCKILAFDESLESAKRLFSHTEISICKSELIIFGSPIGSAEFVQENVCKKAEELSALVDGLATVAVVDPHVSYVAQTISLQARYGISGESDKLLKAIASRKSRTTRRKYVDIISKLRLTISIRIAKSASICIIQSTRNAGFTTEELEALRNRRLGDKSLSGRRLVCHIDIRCRYFVFQMIHLTKTKHYCLWKGRNRTERVAQANLPRVGLPIVSAKVLEKIEDGDVRGTVRLWFNDERFVMTNSETLEQLKHMHPAKMFQAAGEPNCSRITLERHSFVLKCICWWYRRFDPSSSQGSRVSEQRCVTACQASTAKLRAQLLAVAAKHSGDFLRDLPISAIGTRLDDYSITAAVALRLGVDFCQPFKCRCGAICERLASPGIDCRYSLGRRARRADVNGLIQKAQMVADV
ncbi:hypothetical protein GJ496_009350 [Pomphorhynchus laevis]|nr:hypothetical protein GJ496_009350 [Pomphorhynchus laevis]